MTGRTLAHYTLAEKIGEGGMGEVYRAWDARLERDVALKVLPPGLLRDEGARKRFRKEALALSKLNHPNIAVIHDFNTEDGIDFLVMEYIPGETVAAKLKARSLPEDDAVDIALQIASSLQEAHERGFIHRDLKPANVLVTPKKQVKVLDFGLAQLIHTDADLETTLTMASGGHPIAGTVPYMSPEQLRGGVLDPRCDIYSFGVVLYEMVTGVRPFREKTLPALSDSILHNAPQPPSAVNERVSASLENIILKCLEKDRERRYQTVTELGIDLRRLSGAAASGSSQSLAAPATRPGVSRRTLWLAALAALLVLPAILAVWQLGWGRRIVPGVRTPGAIHSVVVLPAKVFGSPSDAFLADAIPGSLSGYLSQTPDLETKVPPSSYDIERLKGDIHKVVAAYETSGYVLSTVNVQAQRLSLNVQLVEARTNRILWSQEFEGQRQDYLRLIRDAADGARRALRPAARPLPAAAAAMNADVELLLQRGLYDAGLYINRGRPPDLERAQQTLRQVLERDPSRAEAAAEMARLHAARATAAPVAEFRPQAQDWALRALKIDPRNSKAWAVLAEMEPSSNYRRKMEYALKAATLGARDAYAHTQLASSLFRSSYGLSLEASRQASRVDPLLLSGPIFEALQNAGLGRRVEAVARIDYALRIEPDMPFGLTIKSVVLLVNHQTREAARLQPRLEALVQEKRLLPEWAGFVRDFIAYEESADQGDAKAADESAARLVKLARGEAPFPRWQTSTMGVPALLARHGRLEQALQVMEARNGMGIVDAYDFYLFNPDCEPLRRSPRFRELAGPAKAGFDELITILRDAQGSKELPQYLERPLEEVARRAEQAAASAR
ncbi:MAG: protein kinase [Acidobacteria bacterium]|nr:protein kinase [Acidobacteriota bacterium]